jgi:GNAT superfamily N-acetyltransferase
MGYRAFVPADWQPPQASEEAGRLQQAIADLGFWGEMARDGGTRVGNAYFIPSESHIVQPAPYASAAHLTHLFVDPEYWGSGAAPQLLAHAADAAATHGFAAMRLFVATGQARARRFYAREGFVAVGEPFDFGGLPALEYQRILTP